MGGHHSKDQNTHISLLSQPKQPMKDAQNTTAEIEGPAWSTLLGENNWSGLLDPLDLHLRTLILRCGDFCQATYDAFNNDANSKYAGSSRYGHASFFQKVMLQDAANYQIASFLYATAHVSIPEAFLFHNMSRESWDRESNWIGYMAITTDDYSRSIGRREIYVAWRGTTRDYEWVNVMGAELVSAGNLLNNNNSEALREQSVADAVEDGDSDDSNEDENEKEDKKIPKVMKGWHSMYTSDDQNSAFTKQSARDQLLTKVKELKDKYKGEKLSIVLTGHSLGASLAVISGFDLVENGVSDDVSVAAFVFGCPQVGNKAFRKRISKHSNLKVLHIKNTIDVIPHYPGRMMGYRYIGTELVIDTRKSPYLKESKHASDWHNLQGILHLVAGWNGEEGEFDLKVKRSVALVNKSCDFLKAECEVPALWWVEKNKGMVRDENGEWVVPPPADEDIPVPEY